MKKSLNIDTSGTKNVELGKLSSSPSGQTSQNGHIADKRSAGEEVIVQREDFLRVLKQVSRPDLN